ncbi:hypothetical protein LGM35_06430 [Burkholderia cenocepacia]|uniref:hypothetical protein n=1 Tax=Burkholderia cenocepacia TaxID=95486 RepID=UPI001CF1C96B|nr:hypothetical protein [Burkholderia cenocepacia]MCA7922117.1 hypothetical protein [Burkholderia cenocepacia]
MRTNLIESGARITLKSTRSFPAGFTFNAASDGLQSSSHDLRGHYMSEHGIVKTGTLVSLIVEASDEDTLRNLAAIPVGSWSNGMIRKRYEDMLTVVVRFPDDSTAILERGSIIAAPSKRGDGSVIEVLMHFQDEETIGGVLQ